VHAVGVDYAHGFGAVFVDYEPEWGAAVWLFCSFCFIVVNTLS
jgi:hypothetical protein